MLFDKLSKIILLLIFSVTTVSAQGKVGSMGLPLGFQPSLNNVNNIELRYSEQLGNENVDSYDEFLAIAKSNGKMVRGDKYLSSDFQKGFIVNLKEKSKAEANLRYNIYEGAFELMLHKDVNNAKKLIKSSDVEYELNGEKFVLLDYHLFDAELPSNSFGYVVELESNGTEASLYKKYTLEVDFGSRSYYSFYSYINNKAIFYIKIGDNYHEVEKGKRKVFDLFKNHQDKIIAYAKYKGFNFKGNDETTEKELIQMVRYYNTL